MRSRMSCWFAGMLWISLATACSSPAQPAGTDGSLRVSCEWPRTAGLQAVAVVPILVIRDGQIVARSILVRDNPAVTLGGMTEGPVTVLAAALAGDATPVLADEVNAVVKTKDTARVVLDLQPQNVTPARMTIFGPLMTELRRIAADIAARDAAFFSSDQTATPSDIGTAPGPVIPPVQQTPAPTVLQQIPVTQAPPVTQVVPPPSNAGSGGGGGGGGSTPQPTPTPSPSSATAPWGAIPGIPSGLGNVGGSGGTSQGGGGVPWAVPSVPSVPTNPGVPNPSVPPIPL